MILMILKAGFQDAIAESPFRGESETILSFVFNECIDSRITPEQRLQINDVTIPNDIPLIYQCTYSMIPYSFSRRHRHATASPQGISHSKQENRKVDLRFVRPHQNPADQDLKTSQDTD